jgi:hypothetical protein
MAVGWYPFRFCHIVEARFCIEIEDLVLAAITSKLPSSYVIENGRLVVSFGTVMSLATLHDSVFIRGC